MADYYDILGVKKDATADEIKKAFRKQAHKYHPDKGGGDEKKFKEANEAYQVLSDTEKRRKYDQYGQGFHDNAPPSGGNGGGAGFEGFDFSHFSQGGFNFSGGGFDDIFSDMFSGGGSRRSERSGADIQTDIEISFEEMVRGGNRTVNLRKRVTCTECSGTGGKKGTEEVVCPDCHGVGRVSRAMRTIFGTINQAVPCDRCHGAGRYYADACARCQGEGRSTETEELTLSIPPGIENGQTLAVEGHGEAGLRGSRAGDLFVMVRVLPHAEFRREGRNILSKKSISYVIAALGGKIPVATIDGEVTIKVPAGTQPGEVFRIRGKGIRLGHFDEGDHLVELTVRVPKNVSSEERKLLDQLEKLQKGRG